ncbi:hypothetical protein ACV356_33095, partial [Pseudomonas aeruginosa]
FQCGVITKHALAEDTANPDKNLPSHLPAFQQAAPRVNEILRDEFLGRSHEGTLVRRFNSVVYGSKIFRQGDAGDLQQVGSS